LLAEGIKGEGDPLTGLVTKAVERVLQEALEQELTDHLGQDHYERRCEEDPHCGYRNGYEPKRPIHAGVSITNLSTKGWFPSQLKSTEFLKGCQ